MSEIKTANPRIPSPLTAGIFMPVNKSVDQNTLHSVFQNLKHTVQKKYINK